MNTHQQKTAKFTSILQKLSMADMKHIKRTTDVDNAIIWCWLLCRGKLPNTPGAGQQLHRYLGSSISSTLALALALVFVVSLIHVQVSRLLQLCLKCLNLILQSCSILAADLIFGHQLLDRFPQKFHGI